MENNLLSNEMLKFLKTYNYIKNNDILRSLSEKVENLEISLANSNDEDKKTCFKIKQIFNTLPSCSYLPTAVPALGLLAVSA